MSQLIQDLKALREFFSSSDKWTQNAIARNSAGYEVTPLDKRACSWCLVGGIEKVIGGIESRSFDNMIPFRRYETIRINLLEVSRRKKYSALLSEVNDSSSFDQIISLIDETILKQEALSK